jgi:hypothetical protein
MKTNAVILCLTLALAGCETVSPPKGKPPPVPTPPVETPPPPVAGTEIDQHNMEKVRVGEALKAYPVGRYVDPTDPNVLHEAHTIYRREAGAAWNLNPNAPTVVPLGPVLAIADPARVPSPLPAELERKIAEQNQLMSALIEQNEGLAAELAKLNKEIAELRQKQAEPPKEAGK